MTDCVVKWDGGSETTAGEVVVKGLRHEIQRAINCVNAENGSNTPDFILADYLVSCLAAFDRAITSRERWYRDSTGLANRANSQTAQVPTADDHAK